MLRRWAPEEILDFVKGVSLARMARGIVSSLTGLASVSRGLTQDFRPGLSYAAPTGLVYSAHRISTALFLLMFT